MTDTMGGQDETTAPAGDEAQQALDVTPEDMITRGVGLRLDAIEEGSPAAAAVADFRAFAERYLQAEKEYDALKEERAGEVYKLKSEHNVGFGGIGEILGVSSSAVLYLYERAQGKSAKQIQIGRAHV